MSANIKYYEPVKTSERRQSDSWGSGHFGAPRGSRTHSGVDFCCPPGSAILSPVDGKVTKLGYPYGDDLSFRYVQIENNLKDNVRVFYIEPCVDLGKVVNKGDIIGHSQPLGNRYPNISEHVHLEIKTSDGEYINPDEYFV